MRWILGVCAWLLCQPVAAQQTWIVDAAGGPGTFRDLPPALDFASDGDTILMRPGRYAGGTTSKGLTILGSGSSLTSSLRVTGLPVNRRFTLVGISTGPVAFGHVVVECVDNAGRIHLDRVGLFGRGMYDWEYHVALLLDRCSAVTITGSGIYGGPAVRVTSTTAWITSSTLTGADSVPAYAFLTSAFAAVDAGASRLHLARCHVQGGIGRSNASRVEPPAPGLTAWDTDLVLTGDASEYIRAGTPAAPPGVPGVHCDRGTLLLDPTLTIAGSSGAPPIGGSPGATIRRRVPALNVRGAAPGQSIATELYSPVGHVAVLFVDLARLPMATPFGTLWFDPTLAMPADAGFQSATEHRSVNLPVPNDPALRAVTLALQSVSGDLAQAALELTNAGVVAIN